MEDGAAKRGRRRTLAVAVTGTVVLSGLMTTSVHAQPKRCKGKVATIVGGPGSNTLRGTR